MSDNESSDSTNEQKPIEKVQKGLKNVVKGIEQAAETVWKGPNKKVSRTSLTQEVVPYTKPDYSVEGGDVFAELRLNLKSGDTIFAESGSLIWMDNSVEVDSSVKGGLFSGIQRVFSGETLFQNAYFVNEGSGRVALAPSYPASIVPLEIKQNEDWILNRHSFLAATGNVNVTASWQGLRSIFGRGKSILTRAEAYGDGMMWLSIFGKTMKHELKSGEKLVVDGINVAAFSAGMEYEVDTKGLKFFIFGGSGFVFNFTGPGVVYTQSRSIEEFNAILRNSVINNIAKSLQ